MTLHYHDQVPGWFDFPNVYRDAIARAHDGDTLVEVGCWKGKSLSFLLVEAANSGKRLRIVGVDHFRGSPGQEQVFAEANLADVGAVCAENCRRSGYPFELLRLSSVEAAPLFVDGSLAFVFIDAGHDGQSVRQDIRAWLPKVRPGGVLAGHDFDCHTDPDVPITVLQMLDRFKVVGRCWWHDVSRDGHAVHHMVPRGAVTA